MSYRKLRIAWSVVWGLAAVLLIVLWMRSYWYRDCLSGSSHKSGATFFFSEQGEVQYFWTSNDNLFTSNTTADDGWAFNTYPVQEWNVRLSEGLGHWHMSKGTSSVVAPYWALPFFSAAVSAAPWVRWRFSIRTLLIATTLVAAVLGILTYALTK